MINTNCQYCVDQGSHCRPLTVAHNDGTQRLVAMVHRRQVIVIEHYKDDPKVADWRDMMMAEAGGMASLGSFGVEAKDIDSLEVWGK